MQSCARYDERLVPRDDVRETVPKEDLLMVPDAGLHGRLDSVLQLVGRVVERNLLFLQFAVMMMPKFSEIFIFLALLISQLDLVPKGEFG